MRCPKRGDRPAQTTPLFRSMHKGDQLTDNAMGRFNVLHMIKRRAQAATLPYSTCCHSALG